jgi:hypothetical protein
LELAREAGASAIYAAADGPEATLPGFWERIWTGAHDVAVRHGRAVVLLDEVQLLPEWASRLKGEWDRLRRLNQPIHIVASGSSALRLASGSRESLAGRFERTTLTHWNASSLSQVFGASADEAVDEIVSRGGYPGAVGFRGDPVRWQSYVRDAIVEPALGRDILALAVVRRPALLRQVFGVAAMSPAQIVSLQKIQGQLQDPGALETIAHYLALLEEAFLVAAVPKFALRATRQRAAPPKLVVLSNALLAGVDPRGIPNRQTDAVRYGSWVENACLAHAWNSGQTVTYWREEPLEVDAIVDGSWGTWALEVKTGAIAPAALRGVAEFARRHPKYRPLVLCDADQQTTVQRLGLAAMSWRRYLLEGPSALLVRNTSG